MAFVDVNVGSAQTRRERRLDVIVHRALSDAEPAWRTLQAGGVTTAYQRWEWACAIEHHLLGPARARPLLLEVCDANTGEPLMLLPLQRRRRFGLIVLQPLGAGVVDYVAPLLSAPIAGSEPELAAQAWAALRAALPRADLLELRQIPPALALGGRTVANPLALLPGLRPSAVSASGVALDGEPDTILRRLCSSQTVRAINGSRRKLERDHEVRFVVARDQAQREAMLDALLEQRRERFRELGRFDLLRREEVERFYRAAAQSELVQVSGLSVDGEWVGMAYGLVHDGAFHGIILAIGGAAWRPFSPGMLLIAELLRSSREAGLRYFDFTVGTMAYKTRFGATMVPLWDLIVPLSLRGRLWHAGGRAVTAARAWLVSHERLHARLRHVRQFLRKHVA